MFSRVDPLIQAVVRKVESMDAKMGIRRDESEINDRNKHHKHEAEAGGISWEDTTEVSLDALQSFLQELLGKAPVDRTPPSTAVANPALSQEVSGQGVRGGHDMIASRAARAYQATGRMVHDRNIEEPEKKVFAAANTSTTVRLSEDFGQSEKERIAGYIRDLEELRRRGVGILVLKRNLTFLESIEQAISAAQNF